MKWQRKLGLSFAWLAVCFAIEIAIQAALQIRLNIGTTGAAEIAILVWFIWVILVLAVAVPLIMIILVWFSKPENLYKKLNLYY